MYKLHLLPCNMQTDWGKLHVPKSDSLRGGYTGDYLGEYYRCY